MQSGTRKASREKYRGFSLKSCPNHFLQQINPKGENLPFSDLLIYWIAFSLETNNSNLSPKLNKTKLAQNWINFKL